MPLALACAGLARLTSMGYHCAINELGPCDVMRELSDADRVWLDRFRADHRELPDQPHKAGNFWVATVPLPDGEETRTFGRFAGMRAWLERWAAGR